MESDRVAIVHFALRNKTRLAALRVRDFSKRDVMVIQTLLWPDEIRDPDFPELDKKVEIKPAELKMAEQVVESMTDDFNPDRYHDDYQEQLHELIQAKLEGGEAFTTEEQPKELDETEDVSDLLAKLEASVKARREEKAPAKKAPAKKAAKKTAAKKALPRRHRPRRPPRRQPRRSSDVDSPSRRALALTSAVIPRSAVARLAGSGLIGGAIGVGVGALTDVPMGVLVGISTTGAVFVAAGWILLWPMDADATHHNAHREAFNPVGEELAVVAAALGALFSVVVLLIRNAPTLTPPPLRLPLRGFSWPGPGCT